tara:strand:+ start:340 stop:492 length:153 start_codon:yes stop_codon:yes gene_type:complete
MKKHFYLLISNKWQICDKSIYLELKSNYKKIMIYDFDRNKIPIIVGVGLY